MGNNLSTKVTADIVDLQQKFAVARAETSALSAEMNKLAKESAAGALDSAGTSRFAEVAQQFLQTRTAAAAYGAEIKENTQASKSFGDSIEEARGKMSGLFQLTGAAAAYEAITKVGEAIMSIGDKAQNILSMSEVLGITTDQFQAMSAAAEEAGTPLQVLARANEKLTQTIREAKDNNGDAIIKLKDLGLTNEQIVDPTLDLNKALLIISPLLKDGATSASEMRAAVALLGGRAAIAAAAWKQYDGSAQGVAVTNARLNATSQQQSEDLAKQGTALHETMTYLGNTAEKAILYGEAIALMAVGSEKAFADLVRGAADADAAMKNLDTGGARSGKIQRAQQETAAVVGSQRAITVATLQSEQEQVEATATGSAQRLALARQYYQDSLAYYPTALVPAVRAAFREMQSAEKEFATAHLQTLREEASAAKEKDRADTASYRDALTQMKESDREFDTINRQNAQADIAIQKSALEAKKSMLEQEVGNDKGAKAQELQALRDLTAQEYALDLQSLTEEEKGLEDQPAAYNRVYNQIRELKAKEASDLAAIDKQIVAASRGAADQDAKGWQGAVKEIESAEGTLTGDLLSKRRSLGASLLQITGNFIQQEIAADIKAATTRLLLSESSQAKDKALEQGGFLYHLLTESHKTAQTVAQSTARTTAATTAAATQTSVTASAAASQQAIAAATGAQTVMGDAAKAFAGTYASVAQIPYVGWIMAPGAAAAAFAEVASMAGIASLATGTAYVPRDMPANLHEGEAVLPKPMAQSFRDGTLGGGQGGGRWGDTHYHTHHWSAVDGHSVERFVGSPKFQGAIESSMKKHYSRGGGRS